MTDAQQLAQSSAERLLKNDSATPALGMRLLSVAPGQAQLEMRVRADMLNGHATCHGGMIFSLADSAFAVACNTHGHDAVAASASIDFLAPAREGDVLTASAQEVWRGGRSGIYEVTVTNASGARIALFRGRSNRISR